MNWSVDQTNFNRNIAVVIGINNYQHGIHPLKTAVNDAKAIANLLEQEYEYQQVIRLFPDHNEATLAELNQLLFETLPNEINPTESDRLLFYFAGHGIARNSEEGPAGAIIPQDAKLGDWQTYLPMKTLNEALSQLDCHHLLVVLDCCFAGNFRWSSRRNVIPAFETIHREHYDRFIRYPAWQAITSAAHNQEALDYTDERGTTPDSLHSPFAKALINGLKDLKADLTGDGVITAPELYLYLRDNLMGKDGLSELQTAGLWPLPKHDRGEFIFTLPGFVPEQLKPAPPLDASKNPYRGLESFDEEHSQLFFGRTELVEKLQDFVKTHALSVVLGASGSGKSSLVKAGLIPKLRKETTEEWCLLPPIRPGETPLLALNNALQEAQFPAVTVQNPQQNLAHSIDTWAKHNPNSKLLLFIDQSEEIITLCQDEDERQQFFQQILTAIDAHRDKLRVVLTLRSDFEPQIRDTGIEFIPKNYSVKNTELKHRWQDGRFIVPAMTRGELREAIEKPAEARVMFFQPEELVEQLIDEVADMPGALPLLSFALSELYLKYLQRQWQAQNGGEIIERAMTQSDYQDLGGVMQSLTQRADEEYQKLVQENPAYGQVIRHVMLRMVALGGGELARRRVPLSELKYPPEKNDLVEEVIERFTKARLLVRGKDAEGNSYVEPAHDALVRGWQKLLMWKQEDEEGLLLQRRLTPAAEDWKNQQQVRFLWNANPRLDLLKKVSLSDQNWLNQVEAEFVQRSVGRKSFNTRRNWSVAIAVILGLGTGLVFSLIGQRNVLIEQILASQQAAEGNLPNLEAWLNGLRAAKSLQDWPWYLSLFKPDPKLKIQVTKTLHKVADGVREWNRLEKHQDKIIGLGISSDGRRIASIDYTGLICLWDKSGKLLNDDCFQGPEGRIYSASFNPDVSLLATINTIEDSAGGFHREDGIATLALWDLETQQQVELNQEPRGWAGKVVFSQDGKQLATADRFNDSSLVRYWNLSGQEISKNQFQGEPQFSMPDTISNRDGHTATFTKNNNFFESYKKTIVVHRLLYFSFDNNIETHHTFIERAVFSPDGQQLITAGRDGKISIWGFKANNLFTRPSFRLPVEHSTFSHSSDHLLRVGSLDTSLFSGCHSRPIAETFSSLDQKLKVTVAQDNTVCLWDSDNNQFAKFTGYRRDGVEFKLSPDGKLLATAGVDGIVKLWDLESKEQVAEFNIGEIPYLSFRFSADGNQLAMVGNVGIGGWWQIESFDQLMERGCNWVRDYLESHPNVKESDRRLCDGVPSPRLTQIEDETELAR